MAKQSLAAEKGAIAPIANIPAIFTSPQEQMKARFVAPYITFAHPERKDEWKKIHAKFPNIAESDMFLIMQDDIKQLAVAKLGFLCGKQYWALCNAKNEIQKVSWDERPKPYQERIEAVVLVYLEDRIVPANIRFKTTKCPAGKALSDALVEASTTEWADKSAAHKETLICQQPFMRFFGNVTVGAARSGKESGRPYRPSNCEIQPTGVPEWRLLKTFTEDPATEKALKDAADRYSYAIAEITSKVSA